MKIRIVAAVCAVVLLCTACGKKTNSSNVTLMEMTNYEHVVSAATLPDKEEEKQLIRDTDGYYVVNDVVYVTSNTLNIRRLPGTDEAQTMKKETWIALFKLKVTLIDECLPVSTPDNLNLHFLGHIKHHLGQVFKSTPVHLLAVHGERVEVNRFPNHVLRLHRPRLPLFDIFTLLRFAPQPFRHIEWELAPRGAFHHNRLQTLIYALQPFL